MTPRGFPLDAGRPPARQWDRPQAARGAFRRAAAREERGRARRDPPRAGRRAERDGEDPRPAPRGRRDLRGPAGDRASLLQRGRCDRPGHGHRLARGADGDRPRARTRPDLGGRGGHRRPVSAGSGLRLLRRHDADVLHGRAARGARPLPRSRQGGARPCPRGRPPRGHGQGATPDDVRSLRRARLPDAADKGSRQAARGRVLPQPRPRRRARGARASEPRTHWAPSSSPAMCSPSSRASTARASAAAGSRTSCSSPTTAARS